MNSSTRKRPCTQRKSSIPAGTNTTTRSKIVRFAPAPSQLYHNDSDSSSDSDEPVESGATAAWPQLSPTIGQYLTGFRLDPPSKPKRCCIAGCTTLLSGPAKVTLSKLRGGLYELQAGSVGGAYEPAVCIAHAARAANCEAVASHETTATTAATAPLAAAPRVCLVCKASCVTYGVACVRHSLPAPASVVSTSGEALASGGGPAGATTVIRLCFSCAHVDCADNQSDSEATSAPAANTVYHFACQRCHPGLLAADQKASSSLHAAASEEAATAKVKQQLPAAESFENLASEKHYEEDDDDEVVGYFAEVPPPPVPGAAAPAGGSSSQAAARQALIRASAALRASARSQLEKCLADRVSTAPLELLEAHTSSACCLFAFPEPQPVQKLAVRVGPACRLHLGDGDFASSPYACPLVSVDGTLVEFRPRAVVANQQPNELDRDVTVSFGPPLPVVRLRLDPAASLGCLELSLPLSSNLNFEPDSLGAAAAAAQLLPLPVGMELHCVYLRCLIDALTELPICRGCPPFAPPHQQQPQRQQRRRSRWCSLVLLDATAVAASACPACRRLAARLVKAATAAANTSVSAGPSLAEKPAPASTPTRLRCLVDLCDRWEALEPDSDLCLLVCHALKSLLASCPAGQMRSRPLPPLACHSRLLQLSAGLLCTLGSRAYSLVMLNLPLGLPSAGQLTSSHLTEELLAELKRRDDAAAAAAAEKSHSSKLVANHDPISSDSTATAASVRRRVKRVFVTIP